ncbi:hypothetical protein [Wenyingzhuangia sp. IMCC45574]
MEQVVKNKFTISLIVVLFIMNYSFSQKKIIVEQIENTCGTHNATHYYSTEEPDESELKFSLDEFGIDKEVLNLYFYSEFKDSFSIYIDNILFKTVSINTESYIKDHSIAFDIFSISLNYPTNKEKFELRVESNLYGCFKTEVRKEYPILYVKFSNGHWYLSHKDIYLEPSMYFLYNSKKHLE